MIHRVAETWRDLNAQTIGTDAYWRIALQNAAFHRDMAPVIDRFVSGRVLDLGAGRLAWREALRARSHNYFSSDVTVCHAELDMVADLCAGLPFGDARFDTIFCCSVLEHVTDPWRGLAEINRVLSHDGTLIVSLPFLYHLHDEPWDYYRFTRYAVEHMADKSGFRVEHMVVNGGAFHLFLNMPSVAMSAAWAALGLKRFISPTTTLWHALAEALDTLLGLKEPFASNHIAVLRKVLSAQS